MVSVVLKAKNNNSLNLQGHLCLHSYFVTFSRKRTLEEKDLVPLEGFSGPKFLFGMRLFMANELYLMQHKEPPSNNDNALLDDIILSASISLLSSYLVVSIMLR